MKREAKLEALRVRYNTEADLKRVSGLSSSEFNAEL